MSQPAGCEDNVSRACVGQLARHGISVDLSSSEVIGIVVTEVYGNVVLSLLHLGWGVEHMLDVVEVDRLANGSMPNGHSSP